MDMDMIINDEDNSNTNNNNFFQVFVKTVDGRTINLPFSNDELKNIFFVKQKLFEREAIPTIEQRLSSYQRDFRDNEKIEDICDEDNRVIVLLSLRINGGKGGFGSQLRGQQTQVGQKKTTNFDACRDLSGRRLREIHTEQKLAEWNAGEKEREYEKIAEKYLREQKAKEEDEKEMLEEMNYFKEKDVVRDSMQTALQIGLEESKKEKRKFESEHDSKKIMPPKKRILGFYEEIEDDDFISNEKQGEPSNENENGNNLSSTTTTTTTTSQEEGQSSITTTTTSTSTSTTTATLPHNILLKQKIQQKTKKITTDTPSSSVDHANNSSKKDTPALSEKSSSKVPQQKPMAPTSEPKEQNNTIDLSTFSSPSDLEKLGLDVLKFELQQRGIKCGGTLQERANRLWSVKMGNVDKKDVIEKGKNKTNNNQVNGANDKKMLATLPNVQIKA